MAAAAPVIPISPMPLHTKRIDVAVHFIDLQRFDLGNIGVSREMVFGEIVVREAGPAADP